MSYQMQKQIPIPVHRSLKPGILAAIAVTISTFLIVGAAAFIWYNGVTIVPSRERPNQERTITDKRNISVSRPLAHRVLQNDLDAAREKVAELEEQEMRLAGPVSELGAMQRRVSDTVGEAPEPAPQGDLAVQLQAAREEINLLVRRIDEMNAVNEEVQAFGWGRGRENEPPPDYE
ncbi:hypothetical protein R3P38DRAFT_2770144 [Favolaschia claudopus]|uniref:Uncharacterized protein n=1 Tax=Favolaschia claudopus TaxID=2862362 RepID=A0AAW0CP28_9AGAR